MLTFLLNLSPPQEFFLLLGLALILYWVGKKQWLPEPMYGRELPITVALGAVGILIPTSISTVLIILYVCWRIFASATYGLCPTCWQRMRRLFSAK
jgi:hypothetical protein